MHRPGVRDPPFGQPVILAADRVGKAQCDREPGRTLEGKTEADDGTRRHIGGDGQIGSADEDAVIVDHLDEFDIGRCVIDLDHLKGVGGTDVSRTRFQTMPMLATGKPPSRDLLRGEQLRDPLGHGNIGRGLESFSGTARADFVDDRGEIRLLRL